MAEYIDRSKIIAKKHGCDNRKCSDCDFAIEGDSWCNGEIFVVDVLRVPAEDVQPIVHGMWMTKEYMYGDPDTGTEDKWVERPAQQSDYFAYCSECDKGAGYDSDQSVILSEYCPHCGARMDVEENK